jgi:hypothetical protein
MLCTCEMLAFILLIFLENSDKFSFWYCLGNFSSVWHLCYVSMLTDHHSKVKFNFFLHCLKICAGLDPVFAITFKHISFCLHCCRCWENGTSLCIITKLLKWPVWNTIVIWCIYYRCELWLYCTISLWENRTSPLYSPWLPNGKALGLLHGRLWIRSSIFCVGTWRKFFDHNCLVPSMFYGHVCTCRLVQPAAFSMKCWQVHFLSISW